MNKPDLRLTALRRFAIAITVLNVLGHTVLGFEQSYAYPCVALATAYTLELLLESVDARLKGFTPRYQGGFVALVNFLLPAHISALAVSMLLYANERLLPIVFATAVAIGSKHILRVPVGRGTRHFLNPSNTGIAVTLLLFPWVGIAPPYMFTENISGAMDWVLPLIFISLGTFLNARLTRKLPLIAAWLGGFVSQALVRAGLFGTPLLVGLNPITGVAFLLFTFYMLTDPATTPLKPRNQLLLGAAVATVYGILMTLHIVFGLFFALFIVCTLRGASLYYLHYRELREARRAELAEQELPLGREVAS